MPIYATLRPLKSLIIVFLFLSFQPSAQGGWLDWFGPELPEPEEFCTKLCDQDFLIHEATVRDIQRLINKGHDVNAYDEDGYAPLHVLSSRTLRKERILSVSCEVS